MCINTLCITFAAFLKSQGFSQKEIQLAQTQVISRTVHPASELATAQWIRDDLTNTYFEGRMTGSKIAKHGRSKEKRSDCKKKSTN
ncbi:hypothetical protein FACS1894195_5440 [Bacteroidia bacterium]|nr:hypothetical protein FACS1894195_5440 [Bacteroidia bacterium]